MKFNIGARVIIEQDSMYFRQNKDKHGKVYEGTVTQLLNKDDINGFDYAVMWDTGAESKSALYRDRDLLPVFIPTNNIEAKQLLSQEW